MTGITTDEQARDELALAVAELWKQQNGWIPGAARLELEEVLGLPLPMPALLDYDEATNTYDYRTSEPERSWGRGESYAEWAARQ